MVEKLAVKHYSQNVKKGEEIIEYHINELAEEGVTYIPPFESNHDSSSQPDHNGCTYFEESTNQCTKSQNGTKLLRSRSDEQSHRNGVVSKSDSESSSTSPISGCCFKTKSSIDNKDDEKCQSKHGGGGGSRTAKVDLKKKTSLDGNNGIKESITNSLSLC